MRTERWCDQLKPTYGSRYTAHAPVLREAQARGTLRSVVDMPRTSWSVGLLLLVCACRSDPAEAPAADDDDGNSAASSSTSTSGGVATTLGDALTCERSSDCDDGVPHCVAPYDAGLGVIGAPVCVASCVDAGDLARACIDDDSCCEGLMCNPVDGFCASAPVDDTTSSTGSGTGGTGGTGSGSSSSGSSSSSTGSSGSSSSSSTTG